MIEHKNTILAIVLSLIVVVGWQFFVGYPQVDKQRRDAELKQQQQTQLQPQGQPGTGQPGGATGRRRALRRFRVVPPPPPSPRRIPARR